MKLQGKSVVITGSTRGIGRAVAEACAAEGARVTVNSRSLSAVDDTVAFLKARGHDASGLAADITHQVELEGLLQHALQQWGRIDVWINNAGLSGGFMPLEEESPETIGSVVETNLTATLQACRLVIPQMIRQGGGVLINMSGRGGRGEPTPFLTTYGATKIAVIHLTKSLAREYRGRPISIHSILPGMVATDFYKETQFSPTLKASYASIPYVLKAVGVPLDVVGKLFVEVASQEPGKVTGKTYSTFKGTRRIRSIATLIWYRITGKIKG